MLWLLFAIVLWGIVHSLLASMGFKAACQRLFGDKAMRGYRLFYNLFALLSFLPILYLMVVLPDRPLYQVPAPYSYLMRAGQLASLILLFVAVFQTDLFSFVGLRQLFEEEKSGPLITQGLYRYVRHPLYTFSLAILWLSPGMTLNTFVFYCALTLYVLVGIFFEERKLLRVFGEEYAKYRAVTPMLIPGRRLRWNNSLPEAS
jgi:protein-S-isoprenylcysteine O-methyltransferase Ste14